MEDPTGGMWIYLIFLAIPLARILPRMLRKYRRKNAGLEPEPDEKDLVERLARKPSSDRNSYRRKFFASQPEPEPPKYRQEPLKYEKEPPKESQPKPNKKDGWMGKDDFK